MSRHHSSVPSQPSSEFVVSLRRWRSRSSVPSLTDARSLHGSPPPFDMRFDLSGRPPRVMRCICVMYRVSARCMLHMLYASRLSQSFTRSLRAPRAFPYACSNPSRGGRKFLLSFRCCLRVIHFFLSLFTIALSSPHPSVRSPPLIIPACIPRPLASHDLVNAESFGRGRLVSHDKW